VGVAFLLLESRSNGGHGDENDDQGGKSALGHVHSLGMVHVEAVPGGHLAAARHTACRARPSGALGGKNPARATNAVVARPDRRPASHLAKRVAKRVESQHTPRSLTARRDWRG
jgi:hypothetical protein